MPVHWADISEYQPLVNDDYPHPVLCIRSNDGTYRDKNFAANYTWAGRALNKGGLCALIVYCVYRQNWQTTADTMTSMIGVPGPRLALMIDVESWGGQVAGNQSAGINAMRDRLAHWIGSPARVIGYGNQGDLTALWPQRPADVKLIIAAYGPSPSHPAMLGHQYSDAVACAPFGPCDANKAEGHSTTTFCTALGLGGPSAAVHQEEIVQLIPTSAKPGKPAEDWYALEETLTLAYPERKNTVRCTPGNGGMWLQEVWWGPTGKHVVPPAAGLFMEQFTTASWEAPAGAQFLVIRYTSRASGSLAIALG